MTMFHLSAVQKHIKERHKAVCPFPDYPDEKATVVAAFALVAGFNVYNSQKSDVMSELALANVEALASGEEGIGKGLLYGTEPDENNQCHYCCCPGDNDCGAAACSGC